MIKLPFCCKKIRHRKYDDEPILFAEQFFYCCQLDANAEKLHCFFQFDNRRIGHCSQTNVAVLWVLLIWEGCASTGEDYAAFFTKLNNTLCTTGQNIYRYKIAALWIRPPRQYPSLSIPDSAFSTQLQSEVPIQRDAFPYVPSSLLHA